ncbi:hypothetical protein [Emergencia sp.]
MNRKSEVDCDGNKPQKQQFHMEHQNQNSVQGSQIVIGMYQN